MGAIASTNTLVTKHDKAVLKVKGLRDRLSIYQKKADLFNDEERELVKQLLKETKFEKAKCVMKKSLAVQQYLKTTDLFLEQLEKIIYSLDLESVQQKITEAMKTGSSAQKIVETILSIDHVNHILLDNSEGLQKQMEIETVLKNIQLPEYFEDNVDKELTNVYTSLNPVRQSVYKKGLKLKTINVSASKSSTSVSSEQPLTPSVSQARIDNSKPAKSKLSTLFRGFSTSGKCS